MKKFEAAIIDLDGVITQTASQHARAWKELFDYYNEKRREKGEPGFAPFDITEDYPTYIDGIPRADGVRNFLRARGISLPEGQHDDEPGKETIWGLGNRKNQFFLQLIETEGVNTYDKNIEQIKEWREQGMKTAVISSSENCQQMLRACGIENLFDTRVDGVVSKKRGIKGKPAPDIFLEAAKDIHVEPSRALVVEDSLAGVEAGKEGQFGWVVGVEVNASKDDLLEHGADQVVKSLEEIHLLKPSREAKSLPPALTAFTDIQKAFEERELCIFLDFDGTLAPIVDYYEDAALSNETKTILKKLASVYPLAIISGRGLDDVKQRVGLSNVFYAGSHGFEIEGPNKFSKEQEAANQSLKALNEIQDAVSPKLKLIEGSHVERKKYALAIHYRQVDEALQTDVRDLLFEAVENYDDVQITHGKKVIEVKPNLDWHKGKAIELVLSEFKKIKEPVFLVYIGDDLTDEDAFRMLHHSHGIGILVGDHGNPTTADYRLQNVSEVNEFLTLLIKLKS